MVGGWKVSQKFHEIYMNIISGTDYGVESCGAVACGRVCHPGKNCISTGRKCFIGPCCMSHECVSKKGSGGYDKNGGHGGYDK